MPPFRDPEDEMLRVQTCGDAVARPLLEDLARENLPFELRGVALATLVERFGYPENAAVVVEGLGARTTTDRVAAARLIARHRDTTQTARLGQLMLREPEEAGAIGFATALGELGDPAAEDDLLTLLARPSDVTQLAAATALGRLGTVRAVEPLLPLTEGLFRDGALRDAAREAVRRIQARLGAVEEGRVSLAPDAAGRLSVVRAEPGAVTLAETKAQR
jgi:HEAT repeat protein